LEDLDTSWIEKEEKRFSIELNHQKMNMESIVCYFVYLDQNLSIQKVLKDEEKIVSLSSQSVGIHNSRILQLIQHRRNLANGINYKFMNLLIFNVDLDVEQIGNFVYDDIPVDFLKEVSIFNHIVIEPSVFIFHPLHSLYFFFKQDFVNVKSILYKPLSVSTSAKPKSTKKVHIFIDSSSSNKKTIQTRKHLA
jgi:hypothetical protein